MKNSAHSQFIQDLDARVTRFGLSVAAGLSEHNQAMPADITERLRFAREQAMMKARSARAAQVAVAGGSVAQASGSTLALLPGFKSPRWLKFASMMPLLVLVVGLVVIQQSQLYEQVLAAAEVDTALLADDLPPSAYSDPGFAEFLNDEQD